MTFKKKKKKAESLNQFGGFGDTTRVGDTDNLMHGSSPTEL